MSSGTLDLLKKEYCMFYESDNAMEVSQRHLPHWQQQGKMYLITFRLADSIPQDILDKLRRKQTLFKQNNTKPFSQVQEAEYQNLFFEKVNSWLDNCYGKCILAEPEYAKIVKDALEHFNQKRYILDHWVLACKGKDRFFVFFGRYNKGIGELFHIPSPVNGDGP